MDRLIKENKAICEPSLTCPHDEIFIVRNGVKSAVTSRQGQYLRPIYDQIREHVKKHLLNSSEGAFILGNYDVS